MGSWETVWPNAAATTADISISDGLIVGRWGGVDRGWQRQHTEFCATLKVIPGPPLHTLPVCV